MSKPNKSKAQKRQKKANNAKARVARLATLRYEAEVLENLTITKDTKAQLGAYKDSNKHTNWSESLDKLSN